jgi:DNA-binding LytR/AlgR family response regulator
MIILIIEDEPLVASSLARMVKQLEPNAVIKGPLASVNESKQWLAENPHPDLILADIQLADGISLDIFSIDTPNCPIIFTTAYNEYAIRAFKVNSIDYLLKPIDKKDLQASFQKFHLLQSKFSNQLYLEQIKALFANFNAGSVFKDRFAVHLGRSVTLVSAKDVVMFVKEELIYLISRERKKFITDYRSLDELAELLDPQDFYRANRQNIIHLPFIESYRSDDTGKITLKIQGDQTEEVIVSKEKAAEFRKWFEK